MGSKWICLAAADPDPPTAIPLKRSPNGVICLRRVNEHRRLRRSLNVWVTFVSALMNNGERGVMEVYLVSRTRFSVSINHPEERRLKPTHDGDSVLINLCHSSAQNSRDITSGLRHVNMVPRWPGRVHRRRRAAQGWGPEHVLKEDTWSGNLPKSARDGRQQLDTPPTRTQGQHRLWGTGVVGKPRRKGLTDSGGRQSGLSGVRQDREVVGR